MSLELGLDTFGDIAQGDDGQPLHPSTVIREVLAEGELADRLGLDFFGVGEHHRDDYAVSAPDVLLAGLATRTERIRLGTSVTVLSSDDPIRVFQRFSTVDALSHGRAEITVGRGSFIESFPLFGLDLSDYETLFDEKLDLLAAVVAEQPVSWQGSIRPPVQVERVMPSTESGHLPVWVGVGGTPQSVVRAAHYGFPVVIAIIGGSARQFAPLADLYRRALSEMGKPALPLGVHSPGHIADTDEQAREGLWPHYEVMRNRIGSERGWGPTSRAEFDREVAEGSLYVGAPETVAHKIAATVRALGADRFDLKYSAGTLPHEAMLRSIELYGREVMPRVRHLLQESPPAKPKAQVAASPG